MLKHEQIWWIMMIWICLDESRVPLCHLPKVSSVHLLRTSSSERILTVSFRFAVSVLLSRPQKVEETSPHVTSGCCRRSRHRVSWIDTKGPRGINLGDEHYWVKLIYKTCCEKHFTGHDPRSSWWLWSCAGRGDPWMFLEMILLWMCTFCGWQ